MCSKLREAKQYFLRKILFKKLNISFTQEKITLFCFLLLLLLMLLLLEGTYLKPEAITH
jgi:hypothetical protein